MTIAIAALPHEADMLRRAVMSNPAYRILWIDSGAADVVLRCRTEKPDLIIMGLSLDGGGGVETTRRIMAATPCAILVVTFGGLSDARRVFEAMGHGALDAVDLPGLDPQGPARIAAPLLSKLATIANLVNDNHGGEITRYSRHTGPLAARRHPLIAIGASAGGPAALATVLSGLPENFAAAIVIVQHVDKGMAAGMAEWLGQHCALPVRAAVEGDRVDPGTVLIAATGDHLALKTPDHVGYTAEPRDYVYRPSVDVFFQSVSHLWMGEAVGVLLTGMGRDGALGLKALRNQGRYTIAQDAASSAVYGMPKAAVTLGAAVDVLPVDRIASRLTEVVAGKRR